MRILVFFDLPTITVEDRREYSKFRRYLIKNGFVMLQESVYYKIVLNQTAVNVSVDSLTKNEASRKIDTIIARYGRIKR